MPYAKTSDGFKVYYEEHGTSGSPLVLAYGIGGNTEMWDINVAALSARHRLILWEPRGHARSDSPEDPARFSFARWVLDLRDLLDHLRLRRAHVGGLSLGAGISTRFTLRFPARVRSLLVTNSSSAVGLPLSVDNLVMRAQSIKITLEQGMDAMAEYAMTANPNLVERLKIDPERMSVREVSDLLHFDLRNREGARRALRIQALAPGRRRMLQARVAKGVV